MKLSSLDIRKQEFGRAFRGYDKEEVHAFLQMLSNQWQELVDEKARLEEKMREQEMKLSHYMKVEEALEQALQTARESSRQAIENAERKAKALIEEAEARAEDIKREAEEERHQIKREAAKITGRRHEIVARLRAFLMSEMELLAHYEGDDPIGFIKLLPGKQAAPAAPERMLSESPSQAEVAGALAHEEDEMLKELAEEIAALEPPNEEEDAERAAEREESAEAAVEETMKVEAHPERAAGNDDEGHAEAEEPPPFEALHEHLVEEPMESEAQAAHDPEAAASREPAPDRPWVVRPLISPEGGKGGETPAAEGDTATSDEIAKIRRILDDLD